MITSLLKRNIQFVQFCLVGGSGAVITFAVTGLLTEVMGLWYMLSMVVAVGIATAWNYNLNKHWTFSIRRKCDDADYEWQAYFNGNPIQKWWKRSIHNKVFNLMDATDKSCLDFGCGSSPLCISYNGYYLGIDENAEKIKFMREKNMARRTFAQSSIEQLSLNVLNGVIKPSHTVLCLEVIEHLESQERAMVLISTLAHCAEEGGEVIIATPNYDSRLWLALEKLYAVFMPQAYADGHILRFNMEGVMNIAKASGLEYETGDSIYNADLIMKFRKK